jgi:hypothetical protein
MFIFFIMQMDEMLEQAERQREQQEALRLEKLPRTLHHGDDVTLHQVCPHSCKL